MQSLRFNLQTRPAGNAVRGQRSDAIARRAVQALLDEAQLAPKPGLVDSRSNGAHADLDLPLMRRSAHVLGPFFAEMAEAAARAGAPTLTLRETLGRLGRDAEMAMLRATDGVNTHRGAIWALGLLVAAASLEGEHSRPALIAEVAGVIARLTDRNAPQVSGHKGEIACKTYGVRGARGQAEDGFPQVIGHALPALRVSRARGDSESVSRLNALLAIMSVLDDTCVLSRAGPGALASMQAGAAAVLDAGGVASFAGRVCLRHLDALALASNASPGGAADLLAATLFLDACADAESSRDRSSESVHGAI
jgi:triphosphoribosyl-dephospho-CoA synthase